MHAPRPAATGIRLGVARGIQYGLIAEPDAFAAPAEQLGARLLRVFFCWSQLEPQPGRYDWSAVDAILDQTGEDTELWFVVAASSPWATARSTDFLPASPPRDLRTYGRMVRALVEHCGGRVRWWQCENEPCNPLFWTGTATEYLEQLRTFAGAVREAYPRAEVVLGGCPPGVYPGDAGGPERAFFERLLADAGDAFDAVDIHLYGDPYQIPSTITEVRQSMRSAGYDHPILAGEYHGPLPLQYPEAFAALEDVLRLMFAKFNLLPWDRAGARFPCADSFAELAAHVTGADAVRRIELSQQPDAYLFEITRDGRAPTRVAWLRNDTIDNDPTPRPITEGLTAGATPTFIDAPASARHRF